MLEMKKVKLRLLKKIILWKKQRWLVAAARHQSKPRLVEEGNKF
jgi:hypothetical protein